MNTNDIYSYVKQAMSSIFQVEKWSENGMSVSVNNTNGYSYAPFNTRVRGTSATLYSYFFSTNNIDDLYYISKPNISENNSNSTYIITFIMGVLTAPRDLSLYATLSYVIDQETGSDYVENGISSLRISYNEDSPTAIIENLPIPYGLTVLPNPVNDALSILRSSQNIITWIKEQNFDDSTSRKLLLNYYAMMVFNQSLFAIEKLYKNKPIQLINATIEVESYYNQLIKKWPTSTQLGSWDNGALNLTIDGASIRLVKPTFFATDSIWIMICKFDRDITMKIDDHVAIYITGSFKETQGDFDQYSIGNVLGMSSITSYNSKNNFSNDIVADDNVDIYQTWFNDFMNQARENTTGEEMVKFALNIGAILNPLIQNLKDAQATSHPGVYDVSQGGHDHVSFMTDVNGRLFTGCAGYVYELDTLTTNVLYTHSMDVYENRVDLAATPEVLYAGSHGKVQALNTSDGLNQIWSTELEDKNTTTVVINNNIIVGCYGKIYALDPEDGHIKMTFDLSSVDDQTSEGDVILICTYDALYCGCNGVVFSLSIDSFVLNWHIVLTQHTSPVSLLPYEDQIIAGTRGKLYKCKEGAYSKVLDLSDYNSHMDDKFIKLIYVSRSGTSLIMAGINGYVIYINPYSFDHISDESSNRYCNVHDNGRGVTSVFGAGSIELAACEGYLYYINNQNYDKSPYVSFQDSKETSIFFLGGKVYAGISGLVYLQPLVQGLT